MQLLRAIISLTALVLCQSCAAKAGPVDTGLVEAASSDEGREQKVVFNQVFMAIQSGDFDELNQMERSFRTSRAKTPSGLWKLAAFHAAAQYHLGNGLTPEDGCVMQDAAKLRKWREADPNLPGPVITEAALLSIQAWCIRGGGVAPLQGEDKSRIRTARGQPSEGVSRSGILCGHGEVVPVPRQEHKRPQRFDRGGHST
jgi:hypothetical protein